MDGASASYRYFAVDVKFHYTSTSRWAWGLLRSREGVSLGETAPSADLGDSSKYSNENFED